MDLHYETIEYIFNLVKPFYSLLSSTLGAGVLLRFIQGNKFNPLHSTHNAVYGSDVHRNNNVSSDDDAQSTTKTKFFALFGRG